MNAMVYRPGKWPGGGRFWAFAKGKECNGLQPVSPISPDRPGKPARKPARLLHFAKVPRNRVCRACKATSASFGILDIRKASRQALPGLQLRHLPGVRAGKLAAVFMPVGGRMRSGLPGSSAPDIGRGPSGSPRTCSARPSGYGGRCAAGPARGRGSCAWRRARGQCRLESAAS
jgi:hypothetical protein